VDKVFNYGKNVADVLNTLKPMLTSFVWGWCLSPTINPN